jgi:23S rRNA (cytosine1962-C5)-methyltransferase
MNDVPDAEPSAPGEAAYPVLKLKRHEDKRVAAGHLWIFSNEVDTAATPLVGFPPGGVAVVRSDRDRFLGYAYVNPRSLIAARILSRHAAYPPGPGLLVHRLRVALALRERLYASPYYRLVHGESDGLPGLVVDRYGATLVIQIGTAGMEVQKDAIVAALEKVVKPAVIVLKNDSGARDLEELARYVEAARGALPAEVEILADGCSFTAPLSTGQKTGWFYDQTANRRQFLELAKGAGRVLDLFSYVGAWGVHAARAGAEVTCVDSSAPALEAATRNATRNGVTLRVHKADAFEALEELHAARETFDLVIVDPPAFIKRRKDAGKGEAAYKRLNQLAMQVLPRDGLLVSCSCSYHLEPEALLEAIQKAGRHLGRFVQVLACGGQSPDHPVHPAIPETRYLKAFLCRVTND